MKAPLRVVLVYLNAELASSRIRILQMAPWLERLGIETTALPYPKSGRAWRDLRRQAATADVVVIQKKLPGLLEGMRWRGLRTPVVFDFDDALPFRQRPKRGAWTSATRRRRFHRAIQSAAGVIAGNRYLASLCQGRAASLLVAPSPVPFPVPTRTERPKTSGLPTVGWIGGRGNLASLEAIAEALRRAAARTPFRLVVISDGAIELDGIDVTCIPWSLERQERHIAELDVGLMPLEDSPWSRGKCAYKALQYMAAGVPVIASPVGMSTELLEHDRNGLLAGDRDAWEEALVALVEDQERRARIGAQGRLDVQREYTYEAVAGPWAEHLRKVADAGG